MARFSWRLSAWVAKSRGRVEVGHGDRARIDAVLDLGAGENRTMAITLRHSAATTEGFSALMQKIRFNASSI